MALILIVAPPGDMAPSIMDRSDEPRGIPSRMGSKTPDLTEAGGASLRLRPRRRPDFAARSGFRQARRQMLAEKQNPW
jgi:hypothetical protein